MCGILGIINVENKRPIETSLLKDLSAAMTHRGPDGQGVWIDSDGQCGLAHRRLSIVDLSSAGHQPMSTPNEKIWVTFNGEIYNYPELRRKMEKRGHIFRSDSDTEVILYLYLEYGERFFEELDGDFGIGLWDCDQKKLILCRDQAGVKPVYYAHVDGRFIFASELKALLRYPGIDKSVNNESFYHYLSFLVVPPNRTLVDSVFKLEAASSLTLHPERGYYPVTEKYWLPLPKVEEATNFADFDAELAYLFSKAVKKRLMADVPVGVLFSGGVDSTLNLSSFRELIAPDSVKTFTVGMDTDGSFHDDSAIARVIAAKLGTEHHELRISEGDLLDAAQKLAYLQDEPVSDPVSVPLYYITRMAKERGVTVLQAGEGADELFCGYDNYRRFLRHHQQLWRPLSFFPRRASGLAAGVLGLSQQPRHRKIRDVLSRHAKGQELFMSSAIAYYEAEKAPILSSELRSAMSGVDSFDIVSPYYDHINRECPDATYLQQITFIELQLRLPELLLMRTDKMSMANSVEVRVPFLDRDIMDFAMRVPDGYKLRGGVSKEPLKRLAAKYYSPEEVYRPKTGFGVPIQHWFQGELGDSLMDLLSSEHNCASDFFDRDAVHYRLKNGLRTVNEAFQLWVVYNFLQWHESVVKR